MGKGVRVRNTVVNGGMTGRDENLGKVFAHKVGSSFSTMKKYVSAGNPNTEAQQLVRATFALTSAGWSALTEAQRDLWNAVAPDWANTGIFGNKSQSGKNLYTGCNIALAMASLDAIVEPSEKTLKASITSLTVEPTLQVSFEVENETKDNALQIALSAPLSVGTSVVQKVSIFQNVSLESGANLDMKAAYLLKYGAGAVGSKVGYEIRSVSKGGNVSLLQSGIFTLV